jgi:tellurite resistance protein TerC
MLTVPIWAWAGFGLFVLAMLALDLGVFHRTSREVSVREALGWTCVWVTLAMVFCGGVWKFRGAQAGLEFFTGYVIEQSLSVDNLFLFVVIFSSFKVPPSVQHRVLFWGILGALVMRLTLIVIGAALVARFHWILYVFGAFLVVTGLRMVREGEDKGDIQDSRIVRWVRRLIPMTSDYSGQRFFVEHEGVRLATPLVVVLIVVEVTDLIFALDSIPAIFAVTTDPFIVFTSNVFAILGLRSLYFVLHGAMGAFHYLRIALSAILVFVGFKMLISGHFHVPISWSLAVIASLLLTAIVASALRSRWLARRLPPAR